MAKLWRYNLHYFDYLQDHSRPLEHRKQLVTDWVQHVRPGMEDAWEPYTVSLRIVNWIKFFLEHKESTQQAWQESLYQQTQWLEAHIEYHILANHYLKNGTALFFAGMYFEDAEADRWLIKGLKILREELDEQFLQDGGHYERSPMYHSICLMDYLDAMNIMRASKAVRSFEETAHFESRILVALDFLNDLCLPDDEIPTFNDSAFGIAPPPIQIFRYAAQLIGYARTEMGSGLTAIEKPHSGYYVLRKGLDMMVIDCGEIGPGYQPGHAHCDTLSYELAINGKRLIVDSGVHDYEPSAHRAYARSTKAHNTVQIDDEEQSEIWSVFRVARRARPVHACAAVTSGHHALFEGAHDGYTRLPGKPIHRRTIEFDGNARWMVTDYLEGKGRHRAKSFVHLHPNYHAVIEGLCVIIRDAAGIEQCRIEIVETGEIHLEESWYFPEFGRAVKNQALVYSCAGTLPMRFGYRIVTAPDTRIAQERGTV